MPEAINGVQFEVKAETSQAEKGLENLARIVEGLKESVASLTIALKTLNGEEATNVSATNAETKSRKSAYQETMANIRAMQQEANIANANARLKTTLAREEQNLAAAKRVGAQTSLEAARLSKVNAEAYRVNQQAALEYSRAERIRSQQTLEAVRINKIREQTERAVASGTRRSTDATRQNTKATSKNASEHKKAGNSAHHHASGLTRLAAALKRILIYRAIRGVIKAVTSAINEGIERMYAWSEANDQVFMRVMDTYATEVQYLKDAIGAALAPLIEMLMPYLVQLVDWFVELINVVNQFFRALAGYDTWLKVDKVAAKFKEDTEGAAKAQKALNNQLMDFDQLNLITTPKSSGKTETETPGLSGHYTGIDPAIMAFAENFREKFLKPLESIKNTLSELWNETLKPLFAEFASGTLETVERILGSIDRIFKSLKENGVIDSLANLVSESNRATWDLIAEVCTVAERFITRLAETGALSMLIDAVTAFSVSGIDNTTKLLTALYDSGAIDLLADGVGDLFIGFSYVLNAITDIADFLTNIASLIIPYLIGSSSSLFSIVGGVLKGIGDLISGIVDMLNWIMGFASDTAFWSGAYKIVKGLFFDPLLGILKGVLKLAKTVDLMFSKNKEETEAKWKDTEDFLATIEDYADNKIPKIIDDVFGETTKKSQDAADKVSKDWMEMASAWGKSSEDIAKKTEKINAESAAASLKAWAEEKAELAKIKSTFGEETQNALKKLRDAGRITMTEYMDYLKKYNNGTKDEIVKTITEVGKKWSAFELEAFTKAKSGMSSTLEAISKMWKDFANNGSYWGSTFRQNLLKELKPLENTKITMQPSQQGSWNSTKMTVQAYAAGGFPEMGSLFVAGERGPEMVSTINGRTGVASGEEITGIAEAVYGTGATEAGLLSAILGAINSKNLTISPSASLGKVVNQSQRLYQGVTG